MRLDSPPLKVGQEEATSKRRFGEGKAPTRDTNITLINVQKEAATTRELHRVMIAVN